MELTRGEKFAAIGVTVGWLIVGMRRAEVTSGPTYKR
jgi:hypothetical protein